jgi:hypothetical protein
LKLKLPVPTLIEFAEILETGEEQGVNLEVSYNSEKTVLHYGIAKDDVDAIELFLFTPSKSLAESMDQYLEGFA